MFSCECGTISIFVNYRDFGTYWLSSFCPVEGGGGGESAGDKIVSPETKRATPTRCGLEDSLTDEDDVVRRDDESKREVSKAHWRKPRRGALVKYLSPGSW